MPSEKTHKAVFFDRDGTLNDNSDYYVFSPDKFVFNPGVIETLKDIADKGYLLFVISNQSGIAKGLYSSADADIVNAHMQSVLAESGVKINEILYCSHHPEKGKCLCRKPQSLLIERLVAKYSVNTELSFMVGDAQRDIDSGTAAGLKGILISPNSDLKQILKIIP
jgi:D-glycero-D-manno-heptose 1,7-bisphosphate phosphatase